MLEKLLADRFGEAVAGAERVSNPETLARTAARGSVRSFTTDRVPLETLRMLTAIALSTPTKSDLQQRDIVIVQDPALRKDLNALVAGQAWIADAPELLVFCGNNRRQRQLHEYRNHPFVNDHLDAFVNAVGDAALALGGYVAAAETIGLGTCPISGLRDRAQDVSDLLSLPDHVFPFAGLAVGWPKHAVPKVSLRLPLSTTVHVDRFSDDTVVEEIERYDERREAEQPYTEQRRPDLFGTTESYGWSEDKARQYAVPERADFGAFIQRKGFRLE